MANLGSNNTPISGESFDLPSGWSFEENDDGEVVITDSGGATIGRRDETNGEWVFDSIVGDTLEADVLSSRKKAQTDYNNRVGTGIGYRLDALSSLDGWSVEDNNVTESEDTYRGETALNFEVDSSGYAVASMDSVDGFDLENAALSVAIKSDSEEPLKVRVIVTDKHGDEGEFEAPIELQKTDPDTWHRLNIPKVQPTNVIEGPESPKVKDIDWANVVDLRIAVGEYISLDPFNADLADLRVIPQPQTDTGYVTIQFDDNLKDVIDNAYPILQKYGAVGCVGVVPTWVGNSGNLDKDDLDALYESGWDINSHSYNHDRYTEIGEAETVEDLKQSKDWLIENGYHRGSTALFFPYGRWNDEVLKSGPIWYEAGYSIAATAGTSAMSPTRVDDTFTVSRVEMGRPVDALKRIVDRAAHWNQTVHFYMHDFSDGQDNFGEMSTDDFEELVEYITGRDDLEIITPSQWHEIAFSGPSEVEHSETDHVVENFDTGELEDDWRFPSGDVQLQSEHVAFGRRALEDNVRRHFASRHIVSEPGYTYSVWFKADESTTDPRPRLTWNIQDIDSRDNYHQVDYDDRGPELVLATSIDGDYNEVDSVSCDPIPKGEWVRLDLTLGPDGQCKFEIFEGFDSLGSITGVLDEHPTGNFGLFTGRTDHPVWFDYVTKVPI